MKRILSLDGGGGSPFRLIGPNADPNNPDLDDIIFDANYETMTVQQKSYVDISSTLSGFGSAPVALVKPEPGRRQLFSTFSRRMGTSARAAAETGPGRAPEISQTIIPITIRWTPYNYAPPWEPPYWVWLPETRTFVQSQGHGFMAQPGAGRAYTLERSWQEAQYGGGTTTIIAYWRVFFLIFHNSI